MSVNTKMVLCPYCGHTQPASDRCVVCGGLFEPLSRRATQIAMGPWFIRDKNNPFRPGCSYDVLRRQIDLGRVKSTTVLRGPSTKQFWSVARNVPGVAHLLGYCHACGEHVKSDAGACPSCGAAFRFNFERNEMGLMFATATEVAAAQRSIDEETARQQRGETALPAGGSAAAVDGKPGADLLDEVIGSPPTAAETLKRRSGAARLLDVQPERRTTSAKPAAAAAAQPLDFTPSTATSPEQGSVDRVVAGRPSRLSTYLLVALNVLVFVLVAFVVWSIVKPPTAQSQRTYVDPGEALTVNRSPLATPSAALTPVTPAPGTPTAPTPALAPTPAPMTPAAPPASTRPSDPPAAGTTTATRAPSNPAPAATQPQRPADGANTLAAVEAKLKQSRTLEEQGKLREALTLLKEVAASLKEGQQVIGLDQAIRTLERRVERENTANFFGLPKTQ